MKKSFLTAIAKLRGESDADIYKESSKRRPVLIYAKYK